MRCSHPLVITAGEPAGIGPDLIVQLAQAARSIPWVVIADLDLLHSRAKMLNLPLTCHEYTEPSTVRLQASQLSVVPVPLSGTVEAGQLSEQHAAYVLACLARAASGCLTGEFSGVVTCPVHKGIINQSGIPFSGHTEFFAQAAGVEQVVMMLVAKQMRVALATTHVPLRAVADAITQSHLETTLRILVRGLQTQFHLPAPNIAVCGLNPHAGEQGHLGVEELEVITPVLESLKAQGFLLEGPLPADTAFTPRHLNHVDAVLAMYHDQGLPVLKYAGFGQAVNVTLGLPFIRTSVDHGTALTLAGTGQADIGSLQAAILLAAQQAGLVSHG